MSDVMRGMLTGGKLASMARMTFSVSDALAEQIRIAAGDNVSAWIAGAARDKLLREEALAIAVYEREHRDPAWDEERWAA